MPSSNASVARSYFDREELFLSPLPSTDDEPFDLTAIAVDDWMRDWVGPLIAELVKSHKVSDKEAAALEMQVP